MATIDDSTRLKALAHLKLGKSARETSELVSISYPMAVSLRKQLEEAESRSAIYELFNLDKIALDTLLETVKTNVMNVEGTGELIDEEDLKQELKDISRSVQGLAILETELQDTALTLVRQIKMQAVLANSSDTVVNLAEALSKLQSSFFAKGTNVQIANFGAGTGSRFEEYLSD